MNLSKHLPTVWHVTIWQYVQCRSKCCDLLSRRFSPQFMRFGSGVILISRWKLSRIGRLSQGLRKMIAKYLLRHLLLLLGNNGQELPISRKTRDWQQDCNRIARSVLPFGFEQLRSTPKPQHLRLCLDEPCDIMRTTKLQYHHIENHKVFNTLEQTS